MEKTGEILHYENITFRREGREILKGVDWHINKGENWALLGLNGSGKSTLLGMIPAYNFPTSGEVRVFGHKFGNYAWTKIRDRVGFVSSTLNNFLSTLNSQKLKDIVISGKFSSIGIYQEVTDEDRKKAEKIIEDFGITYIKDKYFATLSQGEQRRTLLARAFMNEPDLLILDEPFSGFDPVNANLIKDQILDLKAQGTTIILSTHRMESVGELCDSVALVHQSRKVLDGRISEVKEKFKQNLFEITLSEASLDAFNSFKTKNELFNEKQDENLIRFEIKNSMSQRELLQELLNIGKIVEFKEKIPTMNEVFIAAVKGI